MVRRTLESDNMNWNNLNTLSQLDDFKNSSDIVVIFKHSTRCSVSSMAKRNLEYDKDLQPENIKFYYLDLITHRDISNSIAEIWGVRHESPQVLVIQGEKCLYHTSHADIEMRDIIAHINVSQKK